MDTIIKCFIDGSCIHNGRPSAAAGFAVMFPDYPDYNISGRLDGLQTNNRAEYTAFIKALEQTEKIDPTRLRLLEVCTDSMLLLNSVTKWMPLWKKKGWKKGTGKTVLNLDLLQQIDAALMRRRVSWKHVKAHTGKSDFNSVYNAKVDAAARDTVVVKK